MRSVTDFVGRAITVVADRRSLSAVASLAARLVLAILFATYLVEQAPHLVHHLFEHHEEVQADCVFLVAADRQSAATPETTFLLPAVDPVACGPLAPDAGWSAHHPRPGAARAPPFAA